MNESTTLTFTEELPVPARPYRPQGSLRAASGRASRVAVVLVPVAVVAGLVAPSAGKLLMIAVATAIWVLTLHATDRGPGPSALALGTCVALAIRTLTGLVALSVLVLWVPSLNADGTELLLMAGAVFLASWTLAATVRPSGGRRVLVVGTGESVERIAHELRESDGLPFDVIGIVDDGSNERVDDLPRLGSISQLSTIVRDTNADLIVLGDPGSRSEMLSQLLELDTLDVRVLDIHHFREHAFGRVEVDQLSPDWFMGVLHLYQRPYSQLAKRLFDVIVASVALVITSPIIAGVCIAQRIAGGGPVFFRQLRLGEGGSVFEILKFRTMVVSAETAGEAVWASENDARITPIGRVLRRTRIDELPQLWNVLRGEMSIVGPRPERPEFVDLLSTAVPFWTRRHLVKPGITGWAQIRHGYTADVDGTADKLGYDLYYLKYQSLLFDVAIATRTVGIVLTGFGSR